MLETYLQLTDGLITNVIGNLCPMCNRFSNKLAKNDQFIQQSYFKDKELALTLTINKISDTSISVHFVLAGAPEAQGVTLNWKSEELPDVKLPIDALNLPHNVITDFENFMKTKIDINKLGTWLGVVERTTVDGTRTHIEAAKNDAGPEEVASHRAEFPLAGSNLAGSIGTQERQRKIPDMPEFDDEYEIQHPAGAPSSSAFPSIGHGDLHPPGIPKNPLLQPFLDPLQPQGDGGMYPTPNHPLFGSRPQGPSSRRGVPPGARFDDPLGDQDFDMVGSGLPGGMHGPGGFGGPSF